MLSGRSHPKDELPLFTERHAHHSSAWTVPGYSLPVLCVACAAERLGTPGELGVHLKKTLAELRGLLLVQKGKSKLVEVLSLDKRVLEHLCYQLFAVLTLPDASVGQLSLEVLMTLLGLVSSFETQRKLLQKAVQSVMVSHNFPSSLPHLTFLGQLLHTTPQLCSDVTSTYGSFLEQLLGGMTYPDEAVKSAVVYVLAQVCSKTPPNSLPLPLVQNMCRHISSNLATAKSQALTINLLGLVRFLLKGSMYTQCLLQADRLNMEAKGSTFASAFKRVLLSQDELLQISGVQCVAEVLAQHADYGKVFLKDDIAEFLFEALSSKNELLMNALFSCLNSLAGVNEFYSKYHVVYGIEPVTAGLSTAVRSRNYNAAQLGQPSGIPLFSSRGSLQALLEVMQSALEGGGGSSPLLVQLTATAIAHLLCAQHIPAGFSLSGFLPLLATLLQHIEPLASTASPSTTLPAPPHLLPSSTTSTSEQLQSHHQPPPPNREGHGYLTEVLAVFERMHRVIVVTENSRASEEDRVPSNGVQEEVCVFLCETFQGTLLPATLLNLGLLDQASSVTSLFNIATCQLALQTGTAVDLAKKLASTGFIQLSFEMKEKFGTGFQNNSSFNALCDSVNSFLATLCFHLEPGSQSAGYTKDTLHSALPSLNCDALSCLQLLTQRAGRLAAVSSTGDLQTTQNGVLALFYHAWLSKDWLVSPAVLLQALDSHLTANPDVHLLPPSAFSHLTVLYALTSHQVAVSSTQLQNPRQMSSKTTGSQILVRGLLRLPDPAVVFVAHQTLLLWAFQQPPLVPTVTRTWVLKWLQLLGADPNGNTPNKEARDLVSVLQSSRAVLDCLLDILTTATDRSTLDSILSVFQLISEEAEEEEESSPLGRTRTSVSRSLQKVLLTQRVEPLSDPALAVVLQLILRLQDEQLYSNAKLIYHISNIVTRSSSSSSSSSAEGSQWDTALYSMQLLVHSLTSEASSSQIPILLLNNRAFVLKVAAFVPTTGAPKAHSELSAVAVQLIAALVERQSRGDHALSQPSVVLTLPSLTATLLSHSIPVQVAGLRFWRVVCARRGDTGCFVLQQQKKKQPTSACCAVDNLRVLLFLVQNYLIKEVVLVQEAAADCYTELLQYAQSLEGRELEAVLSVGGHWNGTLVHYLTSMYCTATLPLHYVPCLSALLAIELAVPTLSRARLLAVAQLLYRTCLSAVVEHGRPTTGPVQHQNTFLTCFSQLQALDASVLDGAQWKALKEKGCAR